MIVLATFALVFGGFVLAVVLAQFPPLHRLADWVLGLPTVVSEDEARENARPHGNVERAA